jgi:hypothetical protein
MNPVYTLLPDLKVNLSADFIKDPQWKQTGGYANRPVDPFMVKYPTSILDFPEVAEIAKKLSIRPTYATLFKVEPGILTLPHIDALRQSAVNVLLQGKGTKYTWFVPTEKLANINLPTTKLRVAASYPVDGTPGIFNVKIPHAVDNRASDVQCILLTFSYDLPYNELVSQLKIAS